MYCKSLTFRQDSDCVPSLWSTYRLVAGITAFLTESCFVRPDEISVAGKQMSLKIDTVSSRRYCRVCLWSIHRAVKHHRLRHVRGNKVVESVQRPRGRPRRRDRRLRLETEDGVDVFLTLRDRKIAPSIDVRADIGLRGVGRERTIPS